MQFAKVFIAIVGAASVSAGSLTRTSAPLDRGYSQMYNLQFDDAHSTFRQWKSAHPEDPLGAASDAAAYLFAEFDRLHILQSEFFTHDDDFKARVKPVADQRVKQEFMKQLDEADRLAATALNRNGGDNNAKFARILSLGLRSDYLALVEKRYAPSFSLMKTGRIQAMDLLSKDPSYYDAYLAVGVENYMLGIKAAPIRWILSWAGAQTDKAQGLRELKLTAEKGHYLEPFARLLLAVAALRDNNPNQARELLDGLSQEFPNNELYKKELARLQQGAK